MLHVEVTIDKKKKLPEGAAAALAVTGMVLIGQVIKNPQKWVG
ncbi:hypothetical protein [Serratia sp. PL7]|nr:hypothetical protein [Serratia sp. PL7]